MLFGTGCPMFLVKFGLGVYWTICYAKDSTDKNYFKCSFNIFLAWFHYFIRKVWFIEHGNEPSDSIKYWEILE
jgi:hypothetical protein